MNGFFICRVTATDRSAVNLERRLDHEGDPLAITAAEAVVASGVPPWNWREAPGNGKDYNSVPWFFPLKFFILVLPMQYQGRRYLI